MRRAPLFACVAIAACRSFAGATSEPADAPDASASPVPASDLDSGAAEAPSTPSPDGGPPTWCKQLTMPFAFCDDFDDTPAPSGKWTRETSGSESSIAATSDGAITPPNAMVFTAGSGLANTAATLTTSFAQLTPKVTLDFHVRPSSYATQGVTIAVLSINNDLFVELIASSGSAVLRTKKNGFQPVDLGLQSLPQATWTHVEITLDMSAPTASSGGTVAVSYNGNPLASDKLPVGVQSGSNGGLVLGFPQVGTGQGQIRVAFDSLVVRTYPL